MAFRIVADPGQLELLAKAAGLVKSNVKKELRIAINETLKLVASKVAKIVTEELNTTQKVIKKSLLNKKAKSLDDKGVMTIKAWAIGESSGPETEETAGQKRRLSLRHFKPRQSGKGVAVKISKKKGRVFIPGAFMGPRPGVLRDKWKKDVYARQGKKRQPIFKKSGPSIWGVYVNSGKDAEVRTTARIALSKQMERRIRFLTLKSQGKI